MTDDHEPDEWTVLKPVDDPDGTEPEGRGRRPSEVFRAAGVGPEVIGSKRVERCCARWRKREAEENKGEAA